MRRFVIAALLSALPGVGQQPPVSVAADYVLGPGDQFSVVVPNLENDFKDKVYRVDGSGDVTLPYAGRIHAAGLTAAGVEGQTRARLARILKDPEVVVTLATVSSTPVSVLGAVNRPGIVQIEGGKSLFDVLSMAGGLRTDAGYLIHITRNMRQGPIPLPDSKVDPSGLTSTASVRVRNIMDATEAKENVAVLPGDAISVPVAEVVYAIGSVTKSGGFLLHEHESLSALRVLALAEGLQKTAAPEKATIVRNTDGVPNGNRVEISVNLKLLLAGKGSDVELRAGDILFVPNSKARSAGYRTLDVITGMAGAALIYTH